MRELNESEKGRVSIPFSLSSSRAWRHADDETFLLSLARRPEFLRLSLCLCSTGLPCFYLQWLQVPSPSSHARLTRIETEKREEGRTRELRKKKKKRVKKPWRAREERARNRRRRKKKKEAPLLLLFFFSSSKRDPECSLPFAASSSSATGPRARLQILLAFSFSLSLGMRRPREKRVPSLAVSLSLFFLSLVFFSSSGSSHFVSLLLTRMQRRSERKP